MFAKQLSVATSLRTTNVVWVLIVLLFALLFTIERISQQFDYFITILQRPTYLIVTLMCLAGIVYFILIKQVVLKKSPLALVPLFISGLLLRLLFLQSTPIYEDDFYRYFFDGSMSYHGVNPYQYAPQDALEQPAFIHNHLLGLEDKSIPAHPDLHFLANEPLMERVAYPHISTIYPAITQSIFALSYAIKPFNLIAWRVLLILFDVISFLLLVKLLKHMNKPVVWSAIYWLNPLLITETINAGHMDALLTPALLFTLLFILKQRYSIAGLGLAVAVGIKLWPVLLIPSLFKPLILQPKRLLKAIMPCFVLLTIVLIPQALNYTDAQSGLNNYSQYWRTNSFIFGLIEDGLLYVEQHMSYLYNSQAIARYLVTGLIATLVIFQLGLPLKSNNKRETLEHLSQHWLILIACLFFLSPTGYPWYFIWFLPLLALKPNLSLLTLTFLLPLYDLRYPLNELDNMTLFNDIIIPLQFSPPIILLLVVFYTSKYSKKKQHSIVSDGKP